MPVIEPLVKGAIETLVKSGVKTENIVVENVSGSYELPSACSRYVVALGSLLIASAVLFPRAELSLSLACRSLFVQCTTDSLLDHKYRAPTKPPIY